MVVDSSALLAVLLQEPEAATFTEAIEAVERPLVSAAPVVEVGIVVVGRFGPDETEGLDDLLLSSGFDVVPPEMQQVGVANDAFAAFRKGRHRAGFNYGHCFAYALAKTRGLPLLFKGNEFARADIASAL